MKLLDFFKKKEKRKRQESAIPASKDSVSEKTETKEEKAAEVVKAAEKNLGESRHAATILRDPKITEKSTLMSEKGVYVFRVAKGSTKFEIKRAIEELYKVKVNKVNVMNTPSHKIKFGRKAGRRPGYRKAMISLAEGQKIEFV